MRSFKFFLLSMSMVALLGILGCNAKPGAEIVAKVNGHPITADDVAFRLQGAHGNQPQYGQKSVQDIIDQELLFQKGIRLGLDKDPAYRRQLAELNMMPAGAKRLEMARRVFNTQIASGIEVKPKDGREYYNRHAEEISTELHLLLAKFDEKGQAEDAAKKLKDGANFAAVAGPAVKVAASRGKEPWDLGFVKWERIPVDFLDDVYRLKPGEVSRVLGSKPTGYQIVKLIEKRTMPEPGYEKVSAQVMNRLRDLKLLEAYNKYLEALRKEAKIVTF